MKNIIVDNEQTDITVTIERINSIGIDDIDAAVNGVTFTPHINDCVLSWTNDGNRDNPEPVNIKGDDGASAYEIALENNFNGTEEEWLNSLHCTTADLQTDIDFLASYILNRG